MSELIIKQYTVLYDDTDTHLLEPYKWHVRHGWGQTPYAVAVIGGKNTPMHRHLMQPPVGLLVDHINHCTLDNRRENLRICTRQQNMWNRKKTCGTSKYKGVFKSTQRWQAEIYKDDKRAASSTFLNEDDAARWYNEKAKELFGEFACLNIIGDEP